MFVDTANQNGFWFLGVAISTQTDSTSQEFGESRVLTKMPFWLFDRRRKAEKRYNVGPFKRKYMLNEKGDFAYHTLYLQQFLASEK